MTTLTHFDAQGRARMVDVGAKAASPRRARVEGWLHLSQAAFDALMRQALEKGDAYTVAKLAGVQAAKRTAELIPLCHPLPIEHIEICFAPDSGARAIRVEAAVATTAKTGIEMEAFTAAATALLALYDMVKAVDPSARICELRLIEKTGGKQPYRRMDVEAGCAPRL